MLTYLQERGSGPLMMMNAQDVVSWHPLVGLSLTGLLQSAVHRGKLTLTAGAY